MPYENTREKQVLNFKGQGDLDIALVDLVWIGEFAENGWILPIDKFSSDASITDPNLNLKGFFPLLLNAFGSWGGKTYGLLFGSAVSTLKVGDRVCVEPGIPDLASRASKLGMYNVNPSVAFWATPPVHGVLTPHVVHPVAFTFKLPDNVTFAEAAMVEPFAVGLQAAAKAKIKPGDTAVVTGAGTIGIMTALAALSGGYFARDRLRFGRREARDSWTLTRRIHREHPEEQACRSDCGRNRRLGRRYRL
jgi:hypothetical protein